METVNDFPGTVLEITAETAIRCLELAAQYFREHEDQTFTSCAHEILDPDPTNPVARVTHFMEFRILKSNGEW